VSFLRSQGHLNAGKYPIWQVRREVQLASERVNQVIATESVAMRSMLLGVIGDENSFRSFQRMIQRLQG
jgi:hypothetical protein